MHIAKVPLALAAACLLYACQLAGRPDSGLPLIAFEDSIPQRIEKLPMLYPADQRAATAIHADSIRLLLIENNQMEDDQELERLRNRFMTWCEKAAPHAVPGNYPYGKETLVQDISSAIAFQSPRVHTVIVCMGTDRQSLLGAYAILSGMRVAFYTPENALQLRSAMRAKKSATCRSRQWIQGSSREVIFRSSKYIFA
jgi:hypothetical protein